MRIDVLTIFPSMVLGPLQESILKRAVDRGIIEVKVWNIRDFATDKHHVTDDYPYGGGAGMVMKPEPIFAATEAALADAACGREELTSQVILLTPQGRKFDQDCALELSTEQHLLLICGRYEGVDERVRAHLATQELSIGDFVLTGGEIAALAVLDAVSRLVPGVLNDAESLLDESHTTGLLEYPQYTRPPEFRGWHVPDVLLSGNHASIAQWRREQSLLRTADRRPDLIRRANLSDKDRRFLRENGLLDVDGEPLDLLRVNS